MNISIIIPCYNEEEVLPLTLKSLKALALDLVSREDCSEIEFVMVDDGSQDRTFELLTEASKADKRVKVIRFFKLCPTFEITNPLATQTLHHFRISTVNHCISSSSSGRWGSCL